MNNGTKKMIVLLSFVTTLCTTINAQSNHGLIAWYKLNGNTADSSGMNNHGVAGSGVSLSPDHNNELNMAYYFNGTSAATIDVSANSSLNTNTITNLVWSTWFKVSFGNTGFFDGTILMFLDPVTLSNYSVNYSFDSNKVSFVNFNGTPKITSIFLPSKGVIPRDIWYHVAVRIDSTNNVQLFINGILDTAISKSLIKPVNPTFTIGRNPSAGVANNRAFLGSIDEVRVYNRYLDDAEMLSLYTGGVNTGLSAPAQVESKITVYPNPTMDKIELLGIKNESQVLLYDSKGLLIKQKTVTPSDSGIDLTDMISGLYFVQISNATGVKQVLKLQKQ